MGKVSKTKAKPELDAIDLQILAIRKDNPRATLEDIGERVGLCISAVWKRLHKIGESDWIKDARNECVELLGLCFKHAKADVEDHERRAAFRRDLLFGLGVLSQKSEVTSKSVPATADDVIDAFRNLTTAEQDSVIGRLREDQSGEDPDGGVVACTEPPSDPQG